MLHNPQPAQAVRKHRFFAMKWCKELFATGALLLLVVLPARGQITYRFRNYTINDGLSQSSVTSILQDENHALWIGTQDGLNRFDGKNFEIFNSEVTEGIQNEYIKCSVKTSDGKLWFGTSDGLLYYNPDKESFTTFTTGGINTLQVECIVDDHKGKLWLGTIGEGVVSFDLSKRDFTTYNALVPARKIQSIATLETGELVINTEDKGLYITTPDKKRSFRVTIPSKNNSQVSINCIRSINGKVYFGTNQGVFEFSRADYMAYPVFQKLDRDHGYLGISEIYKTSDQTWFFGTVNQGLFTIRPDGTVFNSVQDIFQKNALLFNDINGLFEDASGTIWLATERGLSSFDPRNQGFLGVGPSGNLEAGIPTQTVWSFAEDKDAKYVFVGTDEGVSRYDKSRGKFRQFYLESATSATSEANEIAVLSMFVIDPEKVLVGTADGFFELSIYPGNSYNFRKIDFFKNEEESIRHARVYSILPYKDQQYFLATKSGAVLLDLKKRKVQLFEHDPKRQKETISLGICRLVFRGNSGRIFFATSVGGLNELYEREGQLGIRPYAFNKKLTSLTKDYISSVCQTGKTEYWFGTFGSGLLYWNEGTKEARVYTKREGLPNNVIYSVLPDGSDHLWLSTNKGLCRFSRVNGKTTNYTEDDGLMSNEFNLGAYMRSRSGELYFGGIYGYNFFDPKKMSLQSNDIRVKLTRIRLDKGWLKPGEKGSLLSVPLSRLKTIDLTYRQRSFSIRFQPTDLSNPEQVNYKYMLEGSDDGEILIGNNNEIRFTSLSPGAYKLLIYARIGDGEWGVPTVLEINIGNPFWATWWFILMVAAILGIGIRLFVRKRIEDARREQVRLEMKVAQRTREIRAQNIQIERQKQQLEKEKNKVVEQQRLLQIEKDKTEKLLKNIIPESTAEELKNKGRASARAYKTVSVIFTDFVGFTKIADRMTPTELVSKLDVYFRKFDEIIVKNNLEKIKTIGDAYMCAGGVPVRNNTNPIDACLAALQIQDYMAKLKFEAIANNEEYWDLRLGINTGEVTAGVIGSERLAYDIWGATVNQAQRMEMLGEPGKVTITGNTFKHIEPYFECTFRGKAQTKSRGLIDMYTVDRIKPELSVNGEGIIPNDRFQQIVNLHHYSSINYYKAERHIMKVLEKGLSDKLRYHSIEHTKDVVKAVERIALSEGVTDEGLFLLKSAATYHDAGFVEQYEKNEPIGARLAEEILPKYGYTEQHIETIKELIFVTQIPHKPKNNLEEIICDADLDYLGRDDFHEIADKLRIELREHGKIDSDRKWDEMQVAFLTMHRYFTETSIQTRLEKKIKNLEEVKARLERDEYID
ncbi:MAG: adenylate/guanylate cyclase domain-containing protein [Bacteroidota bacterium]